MLQIMDPTFGFLWPCLPPSRLLVFLSYSYIMPTINYVCLLFLHVLGAVSMNLPKDHDLFILTNRDVNGTFALSLSPAAEINKALSMRNVSAGIENFDEWYLNSDNIANKYNDFSMGVYFSIALSEDLSPLLVMSEEKVHDQAAVWNYTPQEDGTWQILASGFFLGLDDGNTTQPMLRPLGDFGESGHGFWSMIPLPTVFVTEKVWKTNSSSVAAKTSFLGGWVTSIFTLGVTETQV